MVRDGYKDSSKGLIPKEWNVAPLSVVGSPKMCKRVLKEQTKAEGDVPFYKIGTFGKEADAFISRSLFEAFKSRFSYPKKGDVLLSAAGTIGRTVVFDGREAYFQDSNIVWIDNDEQTVLNAFLYYCYHIIKWQTADGGTVSRLYNALLSNTLIAYPTLKDEQVAIVSALSDIDKLIADLEKLIEKKKNIRQGAMQGLLSGSKRLPKYSNEWETIQIGKLGYFTKGSGISREESKTGRIPAVRYGELYTTYDYYIESFQSLISEEVAIHSKKLKYGDIVFTASGETKEDIGKCAAILSRDAYAGGDLLILTITNRKCDPLFMGFMLDSPVVKKQKAEKAQGDAIVHIHADSLSEIVIRLPQYEEQVAISGILYDMDKEIEALQKKLTKYQMLKQGMMQKLLTGEIRLVSEV